VTRRRCRWRIRRINLTGALFVLGGALLLSSVLAGCSQTTLSLRPSSLVLTSGSVAGVSAYGWSGNAGEEDAPDFLADGEWEFDGGSLLQPAAPSSCALRVGSQPGTYRLGCRISIDGEQVSAQTKIVVPGPEETVRLLEIDAAGTLRRGGSSPLLSVPAATYVTSIAVTLLDSDYLPSQPPGPLLALVDTRTGEVGAECSGTVAVLEGRRTVWHFQPQTFLEGSFRLELREPSGLADGWATCDAVDGVGLCLVEGVEWDPETVRERTE